MVNTCHTKLKEGQEKVPLPIYGHQDTEQQSLHEWCIVIAQIILLIHI